MRKTSTPILLGNDISVNIRSFTRSPRAEKPRLGPSKRTWRPRLSLLTFLAEQGTPQEVSQIRRERVASFIAQLLERFKAATANNRFRGLRRFFKSLIEECEISSSPMANMRHPRISESSPSVLREG